MARLLIVKPIIFVHLTIKSYFKRKYLVLAACFYRIGKNFKYLNKTLELIEQGFPYNFWKYSFILATDSSFRTHELLKVCV